MFRALYRLVGRFLAWANRGSAAATSKEALEHRRAMEDRSGNYWGNYSGFESVVDRATASGSASVLGRCQA
jgi:hypothetical protein